MKRVETLHIEAELLKGCFGSNPKLAKEYGTEEVTIDFQRNGNGREIVDFLSYDAKRDIFRCYEIKVTMADFKSKAKKSWYGNYNYLVISDDLYQQQSLDDWKQSIPNGVGIITVSNNGIRENVVRARYTGITAETNDMLKRSLIRSLFYKKMKE